MKRRLAQKSDNIQKNINQKKLYHSLSQTTDMPLSSKEEGAGSEIKIGNPVTLTYSTKIHVNFENGSDEQKQKQYKTRYFIAATQYYLETTHAQFI